MPKKKTLLTAAVAFASSPQGRRLIQQAKEYATRPENQAKAKQAITKARSRSGKGTTEPYGTPPR
jgi:hypothetical protein